MSGDQHEFARREAEEPRGTEIGFRVRLVVAEEFRREHAVPGQARVLRHVDEERDVAVGKCREGEAALEQRQAAARVGPRPQPVPDPVQMVLFGLGEAGDAELPQQIVEDPAVQGIDRRPGELPRAHARHRGPVARAPRVRERGPIDAQRLRAPELAALANDRAAPVDHGAKDIERQGADLVLPGTHESYCSCTVPVTVTAIRVAPASSAGAAASAAMARIASGRGGTGPPPERLRSRSR